jgi:hypothetical protein
MFIRIPNLMPSSSKSLVLAKLLVAFVAVYLTFLSWWWLLTLLLGNDFSFLGMIVGYSLPLMVSLAALGIPRLQSPWVKYLPYLALLPLMAAYAAGILVLGDLPAQWIAATPQFDGPPVVDIVFATPFSDPAALLGLGFIGSVITIMLFPFAGDPYYAYRRDTFIAGVIFMPLFVVLSTILRAPIDLEQKGYLLVVGMLGFWLSAAWLAAPRTQGDYVPGLEIRPLVPFRPDFILPGGVTYVKGTILTGVGIMIMIMERLILPVWNWWGFALAFWGIILLIPLRGMYKMFAGRRLRFMGDGRAFGMGATWGRELLLFLGLLILLYGFVNAFKGFVPFDALGVIPRYTAYPGPAFWLGLVLLLAAFAILVPLRGWYKTRLPEGTEGWRHLVGKQVVLYIGTILLVLAFIHLLNLVPDTNRAGEPIAALHPDTNPFGFAVGLSLFVLGALLILVFRPIALRNEFRATLRTMVGVVADAPADLRNAVMAKRLAALAEMPEGQRDEHVRLMMEGLRTLPEAKGMAMRQGMMDILLQLPSEKRMPIMQSMDKVLFANSSGG